MNKAQGLEEGKDEYIKTLEKINDELVKEPYFSPKRLLMDINALPKQYITNEDLNLGIKAYEKDYNVRLIPVDFSKYNRYTNDSNKYVEAI